MVPKRPTMHLTGLKSAAYLHFRTIFLSRCPEGLATAGDPAMTKQTCQRFPGPPDSQVSPPDTELSHY